MKPPSGQRRTLHVAGHELSYRGTVDTRLFTVLGHPIAHSQSPVMQQAAFDAAAVDACYVAVDVAPGALASFMQELRRQLPPWAGGNVTVPHKEAMVSLVDTLDDSARAAGAVNTVLPDANGHLHGANTDVQGVRDVWRHHQVTVRGQRVVVLGAGGFARAAVVAALQAGASEVCVANRTLQRAQTLLDEVLAAHDATLPVRCGGWDAVAAWLPSAASIVQATACGLEDDDDLPVSLQPAASDAFVLEAVYGRSTAFLKRARDRGLRHADGLQLLVAQGAASWRLWQGAEPDVEAMQRALTRGS